MAGHAEESKGAIGAVWPISNDINSNKETNVNLISSVGVLVCPRDAEPGGINCTTLNNFKSHIHKVLEPETELKSYKFDSERYMAKTCAHLCRQCCFIDGSVNSVNKHNLCYSQVDDSFEGY